MARERCAEYGRISDKNKQENNYSLETQLEGMEERREQKGYILNPKHVFLDKKTGLTWRRRPELQALLDAARRKEFDILLVYDLDRFSRDPDHQIIVMEELAYNGIRIECVLRDIDTTPAGKLMLYILGYSANLEVKRFAERADRGRRKRAERGMLTGGRRPRYGYVWVDVEEYSEHNGKKIVRRKARYALKSEVVAVEADGTKWTEPEVVRYIFSLCHDARWSIRRISGHLSEKGIPSPEGNKAWDRAIVHRILTCSEYIGQGRTFKQEKKRTSDDKVHITLRPPEEQYLVGPATIPSILFKEDGAPDVEKFEKVQQLLAANQKFSPRNNKNAQVALLRGGIAVCGYCGRTLRVMQRKQYDSKGELTGYDRFDYRCQGKSYLPERCQGVQIKVQTLDEMVWQKIIEVIRDPHIVEEKLTARKGEDPTRHDFRSVKRELTSIEEEITTYDYAIKDAIRNKRGKQAIDHYSSLLALALERKENVEGQLNEVKVDREQWQQEAQKIDAFQAECDRLRGLLDTPGFEATYEFKRDACVFFGVKVFVYKPPSPKKPQPVRVEWKPPGVMSTTP